MNTPPPQCEFEAPPTPSTDRVKHGRTLRGRLPSPGLPGLDEEPITTTKTAKKVDPSSLLSAADTTQTLGLPTPAKTPSKKRKIPDPSIFASGSGSSSTTAEGDASSSTTPKTARLLFGEEIGRRTSTRKAAVDKKGVEKKENASPKKTQKVHIDDKEDPFEIYTDPNLRVPEVNPTESNPFLESDDEDSPATIKKQRKARRAAVKRFEAVGGNREDGMVYSFRGKKFFKKFDEDNPKRTITPRLLFPSARQESERALREAGLDIVSDEEPSDDELTPPRPTLQRAHSRRSSGGSNGSVMDSGKITKSGGGMILPTSRKLRSTPGKVDEVPRMWSTPQRKRKIHFKVEEEEEEEEEEEVKEVVEETVEEEEKVLKKKAIEKKSKKSTKITATTTTEDEDKAEEQSEEEKEATPEPSTPKDQIVATPRTPPRIPNAYKGPTTPQRKTRLSHKRGLTESPDQSVEVGPARKVRRRV